MSVHMHIRGANGVERGVHVTSKGGLLIAQSIPDVLPFNTENKYRYFNSRLGSTGAGSGTTNQNVNGASTTQEFYISSDQAADIYIMLVVVIIADTAVAHNSFGNVSALTNGWSLIARESGEDTAIVDGAKTGGQVIAQSGFNNAYGDGVLVNELSNWTGLDDAQTVAINIGGVIPGGLRIGRGTKDRLISRIRDDLTGLTEFYVRAIGYKHYD